MESIRFMAGERFDDWREVMWFTAQMDEENVHCGISLRRVVITLVAITRTPHLRLKNIATLSRKLRRNLLRMDDLRQMARF